MPTMIGEYQLVARLGGGSMADLYIAHKMSPYGFVRRAVIKRVKRSRADYKILQRMLLDEARATACFDHPNLIAILDVGEYDDGVYMALEYVEGTDLRRVNNKLRQKKEALPFELACYVVAELLRGLHHAHTARGPDGQPLDIIHRDVNPSNVLISMSGHVKLADFGVVRMRDRVQAKTEPGLVKGKYAYLAPEYIAGEACSVQTDIYAAGIMLFELLSGRECFTGKTAYEVMWKIVNKGVPMYRLEREGVPEDLQRIVQRATATAPERRYNSAQDMANALEAWLMRSGRHATAWVLSVFFMRHELFPESPDPLRASTLPLANAEQALENIRAGSKRGKPPVAAPQTPPISQPSPSQSPSAVLTRATSSTQKPQVSADDLQVHPRASESPTPFNENSTFSTIKNQTEPRNINPDLTPAPVLEYDIPEDLDIPILPPEFSEAGAGVAGQERSWHNPSAPPQRFKSSAGPMGAPALMPQQPEGTPPPRVHSEPPPESPTLVNAKPPAQRAFPDDIIPEEPEPQLVSAAPSGPSNTSIPGLDRITEASPNTGNLPHVSQSPTARLDAPSNPSADDLVIEAPEPSDSTPSWLEVDQTEPTAAPETPKIPPKAPPPIEAQSAPPTGTGNANTFSLESGKLEETPAVDVLAVITEQKKTGVLEFRCGLIWKRVQVDQGVPLSISSNMGMELIGEHLVKARLLGRKDLDQSLQRADRERKPLTLVLLKTGILEREVLEEELGRNLAARLNEVLEWRWGTYEFKEQPLDGNAELTPKLDLAALIAKAREARAQEDSGRFGTDGVREETDEHNPQKKLKEALKVARSIAKSTGKGRVDRPWRPTKP